MDESLFSLNAGKAVRRIAMMTIAISLLYGCRKPRLPVFDREPLVIMYDSADEPELRSGKPLRFGLDGVDRYIDTLAEPVAVSEWSADHCKWNIFVATNRGCLESPDDPEAANRVLSEVHYGRCDVMLPRNDIGLRMEEKLRDSNDAPELPDIGEASFASHDVSAAISSSSVKPNGEVETTRVSEAEFLEGVSEQVVRSRQKDLLVFVHGFNVSFEAAVARTAQVAMKIPFNGAVVSYCWPTQCGIFNYNDDEPINKASVAPFTQFLTTLRNGVASETRIHIVVHSMGNRIVMESLNQLPTLQSRKPFGHIVLCAPDVGHRDFLAWAPGVVAQSERVTLYANSGDSALIVSKGLHAEKRAGDAEVPLIVPGVETIDCSRIEDSLAGHSYYGDNRDVTTDLFMLLKEDLPPSKRFFLKEQEFRGSTYWQFSRHAPKIMCTWHFEEQL